MGVEAAQDPSEAVLGAREPELLGERRGRLAVRHRGVSAARGVVERRVQRVDGLGLADAAARDAGGERARVAHDEDVADVVGGDRGDLGDAEVVVDVQVAQVPLVGVRLPDLDELSPVAQRDRGPVGGERVGQDVVDIDAVPAVHLDLLVEEAWRDAKLVRGREPHRDAPAEALAGVHVVQGGRGVRLDGAVRRCLDARRVDVATQGVVVRGRAQRCDLSQGDVEAELDVSSLVAVLDRASIQLSEPLGGSQLGLVGDVANRAGLGAGAEEGALGAAEDLDAVGVEKIEVRREQGHRDQ